jgi:hypothetical protein
MLSGEKPDMESVVLPGTSLTLDDLEQNLSTGETDEDVEAKQMTLSL